MQNAVRVVRTSKLSTNAAAIHFKVPRRTLRTSKLSTNAAAIHFKVPRRTLRTSKLSTNAAAIHFKVPRRTLRTYSVENKQSISKMKGKTVLSPQQEKELSKRIIRLAQTGYPINLKILRMCVFTNCEKNNILSQFVTGKRNGWSCLGRGYFLCRHSIIASRKAQNRIPGRAQKLSGFIVIDYCAKLRTTMEELGVMNKTECIYNGDEKGFRFAFTNSPLY